MGTSEDVEIVDVIFSRRHLYQAMQHRQGYNFATGDDIARRTAREIFEPWISVTPRVSQPCTPYGRKALQLYSARTRT